MRPLTTLPANLNAAAEAGAQAGAEMLRTVADAAARGDLATIDAEYDRMATEASALEVVIGRELALRVVDAQRRMFTGVALRDMAAAERAHAELVAMQPEVMRRVAMVTDERTATAIQARGEDVGHTLGDATARRIRDTPKA